MNKFRRSGRLLAILAVPFLATACSDDDDDNITDPGEVGVARVRVVHLSPDAPAVDVSVNGAVAFSGLPYLESTEYARCPPVTPASP